MYSSDIVLKNFVILFLLQQSLAQVLTRGVRMKHGIMNIKGNYSCLYDMMLLKFSIVAKWNLNNLMKIFIVQKAILYDNVQYQFLRLNLEMGCVGETKLVV